MTWPCSASSRRSRTAQTSTVSITIDYDFELLLPIPMEDIVLQGRSDGYISFSPVDPVNDLTGDCDAT